MPEPTPTTPFIPDNRSVPPEPGASRSPKIGSVKQEALHGLLTARALFNAARRYCLVRDRHLASAGLVILQDAFEFVLYSCLVELGADEVKSIESLTFDQLIGDLRKLGHPIIKSGTLKAMNKQRVLIKHHAQLAEPLNVQNYHQAALQAADALLEKIAGKPLQQIVIADAIRDQNLKQHIADPATAIEDNRYLDAMISCRKALYLSVEAAYDIRECPSSPLRGLLSGCKAPYHTRNPEWIQENVREPTEHIQLDYDRVRLDLIEAGIDPEEFLNVWHLTPSVYLHPDHGWATSIQQSHHAAASEDNARYCLDVVVTILTNLAAQTDRVRRVPYSSWKVRLLRGEPLRLRASAGSPLQGRTLPKDARCDAIAVVNGLDGPVEYVELDGRLNDPPEPWSGFIPKDACKIEEP